MPHNAHVSLDLPQNIYDEIVLLSHDQHKSINQIIVEALEISMAASHRDYNQPEYYPLGPSPWESGADK